MLIFAFDAETDGLYGSFLSIAAVLSGESGEELALFYGAVKNAETGVKEEWVKENVCPFLKNAREHFDTEDELCESFWEFWCGCRDKAKKQTGTERSLMCIADVPYPVETRLMEKCVRVDVKERSPLAPYPLYDLSSFLKAKGIDDSIARVKLSGMEEVHAHDALDDVRMLMRILAKNTKIFTDQKRKDELPYSYHTFFFPFFFSGDGGVSREEFIEKLSGEFWKNTQKGNQNDSGADTIRRLYDSTDVVDCNDARLLYNEYAYFNTPARNAIYASLNDDVVSCYTFKPETIRCGNDGSGSKAKYHIEKTCTDGQKRTYWLDLNGIKLKLYNTGVGIMIFECEYRGECIVGEKPIISRTVQDVRYINEYGRRISPPYLPVGDAAYALCADRLGVVLSESENLISDLKGRMIDPQLDLSTESKTLMSERDIFPDYVAPFICKLLSYGCESHEFTADRSEYERFRETHILIHPCVGDRMYVACLLRDDEFGGRLHFGDEGYRRKLALEQAKKEQTDEYKNLISYYKQFAYERTGNEMADELYALIAVDADGSSCQNTVMTQRLLDEFMYVRWRNYHTYHAVTHHSIFCITGESPYIVGSVINPFLMHYQQMFCLVIAQRASIIALHQRAAALSKDFSKSQRRITAGDTNLLVDLQEQYIAFQNQLLFFEVTPEEQGVEVYRLMQHSLYIAEEKEQLEGQLQNLYEATNVSHDVDLNRYGLLFAVVSLLLAVVALFPDCIGNAADPAVRRSIIVGLVATVLIALVWWVSNRGRSRS